MVLGLRSREIGRDDGWDDYIESVDSVSWSIDGNRQCFGGGKEGDIIDTKIVVDGGWLVSWISACDEGEIFVPRALDAATGAPHKLKSPLNSIAPEK